MDKCGTILNTKRRKRCPECWKKQRTRNQKQQYDLKPDKHREYARKTRLNLRNKVIDAYGGKCACCGEPERVFLTIEHKDRDGAEHRRSLSKNSIKGDSVSVYRDIKKKGFPKDKFELLCFNCNRASWVLGLCPHRVSKNE